MVAERFKETLDIGNIMIHMGISTSEKKSKDLSNFHIEPLNRERRKALRLLTRHVITNWELVYSKLPGNLSDEDFDVGDLAAFIRKPDVQKTRIALKDAEVRKEQEVTALIDLFAGRGKINNWSMSSEDRRGLSENISDYLHSFKLRRPSLKKRK